MRRSSGIQKSSLRNVRMAHPLLDKVRPRHGYLVTAQAQWVRTEIERKREEKRARRKRRIYDRSRMRRRNLTLVGARTRRVLPIFFFFFFPNHLFPTSTQSRAHFLRLRARGRHCNLSLSKRTGIRLAPECLARGKY